MFTIHAKSIPIELFGRIKKFVIKEALSTIAINISLSIKIFVFGVLM